MKITQLDNVFLDCSEIQYSHEDLEKEYDAYICLKIINLLKESGLINDTEKKKLQIKMIEQFTPYLSKIVHKSLDILLLLREYVHSKLEVILHEKSKCNLSIRKQDTK